VWLWSSLPSPTCLPTSAASCPASSCSRAVPPTSTSDRRPASGVRVHRLCGLDGRVLWNLAPPRLRIEDAALAVCAGYDDRVRALALILDLCRRRLTTPARLSSELARRPRNRHRAWLHEVLLDAADGTYSVLESNYRHRVERPHGLPRSEQQVRARTEDGIVYRDATYAAHRLVVELDGRNGHEPGHDRWDDQDRDLLVATDGVMTLRLGWRHCESSPCRTAARLARVLQSRGWTGRACACGPGCPVGP
jgi:hypothetical protein